MSSVDDVKPKFELLNIHNNLAGWGPTGTPVQFQKLPFQPFSKGDKVGKVADWTGTLYQDRGRHGTRYLAQYAVPGGQVGTTYAYYHEEEDSTFQLVDTSRTQRTGQQKHRSMKQQQFQRKLFAQRERERRLQLATATGGGKAARNREKDRQRLMRRWQKQYGGRQRFDQRGQQQQKQRAPSVQIKPDWEVLEEIDFPRLSKLQLPSVSEESDRERYGTMEYYDKSYDRITSKSERPLTRIQRTYYSVTTTDDPVIQKLAKNPDCRVFATDAIIATLMCCTRSVYSWDIVVYRIGNKLFFDKRDNSDFDHLTVCETAVDPPQEDERSINSPKNLSLEATFINRNFSQQVLKTGEERYQFERPNPFADPDLEPNEIASVGYRYRVWNLGNDVKLVCRCEHDGVVSGPNGEVQFLTIKAFNEWDSRFSGGVDWRPRIDNQRGAVLATELKNNMCKLAKWAVQALLAGSDYIKFGYVSRVHGRDSTKHVILGTQQFKPSELASQINLSMENAWGILRCLVDMCLKLPVGKYLIMKDPNKPVIRLYRVPQSTFEDEDEDAEEEREDDEEELPK